MLEIANPVIVARSGDAVVLMPAGANPQAPQTQGQVWTPGDGYSRLEPLQVHLKFLYYLEEVNPPQPWQEPAP